MKLALRLAAVTAFAVGLSGGPAYCQVASTATASAPAGPAVNELNSNGLLANWSVLVCDVSPVVNRERPDEYFRGTFDRDYLASVGGQVKAVLAPGESVKYTDEASSEKTARVESMAADSVGWLRSVWDEKAFGRKVAYAFCHLKSDKAQKAVFFFGCSDEANIWINGELVYQTYVTRLDCQARQDVFRAQLHQGLNTVMVKASQRSRSWVFVLEAFGAKDGVPLYAKALQGQKLREFQRCGILPTDRSAFMFEPGSFPEVQWENPQRVEQLVGAFALRARWFDGDLNEVTKAAKPGRYAVVVDGTTDDGLYVRRALTFYCRPADWHPWENNPKAYLDYLPGFPLDEAAFEGHKDLIASTVGGQFLRSLGSDGGGPVLMCYLTEVKPSGGKPSKTDTPAIRNQDYHLALKRKLLGVERAYPSLKMPRKIEGSPAPVLRTGTTAEAGVRPETAENIRAICRQWYAESKEPFVTLVARRGVIVIHEAFGEGPSGPVKLDTPKEMASLTKLMTGLMFAQFADQGLIRLVGKFLPDFPTTGDKAVTLRHCFTHTTGLEGHYMYAGMHNPCLDNVIANGLDYLTPGKTYLYNGMGFDLAGEVMEIVSGKSIFRLMHENFFGPLGVANTDIDDLACATRSTAEDMARMGQLMLNRGSYGDLEFFSPETFGQLLPRQLEGLYPAFREDVGIGMTWLLVPDPRAGMEGVPAGKLILHPLLGHGAASSAILRVDRDNELVISQTRNAAGKDYNKFLGQFMLAIEQGLAKE